MQDGKLPDISEHKLTEQLVCTKCTWTSGDEKSKAPTEEEAYYDLCPECGADCCWEPL